MSRSDLFDGMEQYMIDGLLYFRSKALGLEDDLRGASHAGQIATLEGFCYDLKYAKQVFWILGLENAEEVRDYLMMDR
jgi:hypothetical protein